MQCYNSYQLIFETVIASKSVHKLMIDTYIRLYLTHTDLQINIHVNIKSLTVNLLQVLSFTTNSWVFSDRCLQPLPVLSLYYS